VDCTNTPSVSHAFGRIIITGGYGAKFIDISGRPDVPSLDISPVESENFHCSKIVLLS